MSEGRDEELCRDLRLWRMPEAEIEALVGHDGYVPDEPDLWEENEDYFRAFLDLSASRAVGFGGVGAIPVSEVAAYWSLAPIDDFLTFLRRIRAADDTFLAWQRDRKQ